MQSLRRTIRADLVFSKVGRGLRLSPHTSKEDCHIIDVVDSTSEGLIVSPTLLGLIHDDLGIETQEEREERESDPAAGQHLVPLGYF